MYEEMNHYILKDKHNINTIKNYVPKNNLKRLYKITTNNEGNRIYNIFKVNEPILYIKDIEECYIILPENYYENEFYRKEIDKIYENELGNDKVMMINKLENSLCELIIFKIDVTELLYIDENLNYYIEEQLKQLYKDKYLDKLFTHCIEIYSRKLVYLDNPYYYNSGTKYLRRVFLPNLQNLTYKMFDDYTNLETLDISNCKLIEAFSLRGTNIKCVNCITNNKIEIIENSAFEYSLIDRYDTNIKLLSIGPYAFSHSSIKILNLHKDIKIFDLSSIEDTSIGKIEPFIIPHTIKFNFSSILSDENSEDFLNTNTPNEPFYYKLILDTLVCSKEYKKELNNYFNDHFYKEFENEYGEYFDVPFDQIFIPDINFKNIVVLPNIKLTYGNLSIYPYLNNNAKTIINTLVLIQNRLSTTSLFLPKELYFVILSFIEIYTLQTNNI